MKQEDKKEECGMLPLYRCINFGLYCKITGYWKILSSNDMIYFSLNKISGFLMQKNLKELRHVQKATDRLIFLSLASMFPSLSLSSGDD